jgi:hypothetical protein
VLWLHCLAAEGPVTDAYTFDSDYTQITQAGTNAGVATDDIHVTGGYRIDTVLSDTVTTTSNTADRDYSQVLNAIWAVPAVPTFPTTPILDDFNRANENPLDNGTWDTTNPAYAGTFAQLLSNRAGPDGSWWLDEFDRCTEVYATIPVFENGATLHSHGAGRSDNSTLQAMSASWRFHSGDNRSLLMFGRSGFNGLVTTQFVANCYVEGADGYKFGLQRVKHDPSGYDYIDHLWIDRGNGWEEIAARSISLGLSVHEAGKAGIGLHSGNARIDDFGGGEIECFVWPQEFIRRPWRYQGNRITRQV